MMHQKKIRTIRRLQNKVACNIIAREKANSAFVQFYIDNPRLREISLNTWEELVTALMTDADMLLLYKNGAARRDILKICRRVMKVLGYK